MPRDGAAVAARRHDGRAGPEQRAQNSGPVAPAAIVTGEAEAFELLAAADQGVALSPLATAPTTSPRQTFASFRALSQGAASSPLRTFDLAAEDGALFDSEEVLALKEAALDQFGRAASTLDLSGAGAGAAFLRRGLTGPVEFSAAHTRRGPARGWAWWRS